MLEKNDDKYFKTTDLGLASALVAVGFPAIELDKTNPSRVKFFFKHSDDLDKCIQAFWANSLQVSAQNYFNAMKIMKNRIYRS